MTPNPKKEKLEEEVPRVRPALRWRLLFMILAGIILVAGGAATAYAFSYKDLYLPRTEIAGVSVGGLSKKDAAEKIAARQKEFGEGSLTLSFDDREWQQTPQDLGTSIAGEQALAEVWAQQKGGTWKHQMKQLVRAPLFSTKSEAGFAAFSEEGKKRLHESVLTHIEVPYQEVNLAITATEASIVPGKAGKRLNEDAFEMALYKAFRNRTSEISLELEDFEPHLTVEQAESARALAAAILEKSWIVKVGSSKNVTVGGDMLAAWLTTKYEVDSAGIPVTLSLDVRRDVMQAVTAGWAKEVDRLPTNAQLEGDNTSVRVVSEGQDGIKLNTESTIDIMKDAFFSASSVTSREITALIETDRPAVRADTLASLGITQKIGTATTDYAGSPTNRRANIVLGQKKLNGKLVKPGEVYSTIESLGPITNEAGFLSELVIKNNRTLPEAGGGLCQVSTTLFRAVLNAGQDIVERANHSYRVGYYERVVGPGLDATIYEPKPDFRWKNDMQHAIYVQSASKGNTITFDLYGTSDGRVSTISKPVILEETPPGDPVYSESAELYVGERRQLETPHGGAKTVVEYVVTRDGKEIIKETFRSTYKSWPAQYLIGTKPRPEVTPEPTQ